MSYRIAIAEQRALLEKAPNDVKLLIKLGELLYKAGNPKQAAHTFLRAANCYLRDGLKVKAVALLTQVLKLHPQLSPARELLALTYRQLGHVPEAIESYRALLREHVVLERAAAAAEVVEALADLGARL